MSAFLSPNLALEFDLSLARELRRDLHGQTFSDAWAYSIGFGENRVVENCCFVNCHFNKCRFNIAGISNVTFINCRFAQCMVAGQGETHPGIFSFDSRSSPPEFLEQLTASVQKTADEKPEAREEDGAQLRFEREVLENFWPPGRPNFSRRRSIRTLYMGVGNEDHDAMAKAIRWLSNEGLIFVNGDHADLNLDRLNAIMALLDRV